MKVSRSRITEKMGILGTCLAAFFLLSMWGCPSPKPNPDGGTENVAPDSGTPPEGLADKTSPLTCEAGTLCISVGNDAVRGCDLLLKNKAALSGPQVNFKDNAVGEFKYRDNRIALAFIAQKDEAFGKDNATVLIKLKDGIAGVELGTTTCYDRKGATVKAPAITLKRP